MRSRLLAALLATPLVALAAPAAAEPPRTVDVPVLNRVVAPGQTITLGDLERAPVRVDRLPSPMAASEADIVGKTPRRALRPFEPLRTSDLQVPVLVRRGELVTLVFETPVMRLAAQAKAMEDGGAGQSIRFQNTRSGRAVEGTVTAAGLATASQGTFR